MQVKRTILKRFSQQYISQSNIIADFLGKDPACIGSVFHNV